MNESKYNEILLKMMRKVPDSYKGYVNTAPLDEAYAADQIGRDLNYQRLGAEKESNARGNALNERRLDTSVSNFNRDLDFQEDQIDSAQSNMTMANLIGGANVGVNYLQGANQRKANKALTDLLNQQTAFYKSLQ